MFCKIDVCPVCQSNAFKQLFEITHTCGILASLNIQTNERSFVYECKSCHHNFLSPVLSDKMMLKYYNKINSEYFNKDFKHYRIEEDRVIFNKIYKLKKHGNVLEIGCGSGYFLKLFKDKGFDCKGVEPSPKAAEFAREQLGLDVINGFLEKNTFADNEKYDIILLMDVIEHIYTPNELLSILTKLLAVDGLVVILTGNVNSANAKLWKEKWFYFYSWEHISFFNRQSISKLLNSHGYKKLKICHVSHQSGVLRNIYLFLINNPLMYVYNFWIRKRYKHISLSFDHILVFASKL